MSIPAHIASLLEETSKIIEAKSNGRSINRNRRVPMFMPDGSEVASVKQAAICMGVDDTTAAMYALESKDASEELKVDATAHLQKMEYKKRSERHVRTPAGQRRYGQPIGTRIVIDSDTGEVLEAIKPDGTRADLNGSERRTAPTSRQRPEKRAESPTRRRRTGSRAGEAVESGKDKHQTLRSDRLNKIMKAHRSKGSGTGSGTIDDPINVKGDIHLAAKLLAEGKHIRLNKTHDVGTLLDRLNEIVDEAREKGDDAPNFDLCKVSVPKTNLFCAESKGIPRAKMPQLGGTPREGSRAWDLPRNKRGEVNIEDAFREELKQRGVNITGKNVKASWLKASQIELDGPKVAGMSRAMEQGKVPDAPIFVTRDGYIIDGHHRWASKVAIDARGGELGKIEMPVEVLDMDIGEALDFANAFALEFGIMPKGLGSAAEGVKWLRGMFGLTEFEHKGVVPPFDPSLYETKTIRRVASQAGVNRFKQPLGTIIVRDGDPPLQNVTILKTGGKSGFDLVQGPDGSRYEVGYDSTNEEWVATGEGDWNDLVVIGAVSEEDVYDELDNVLSKPRKRGASPRDLNLKPRKRAAKKTTATAKKTPAQRNAEAEKEFPKGTQINTTVYRAGGKSDEVTGTVIGYDRGVLHVRTDSGHGDLMVERDKARKIKAPKKKTPAKKTPASGKTTGHTDAQLQEDYDLAARRAESYRGQPGEKPQRDHMAFLEEEAKRRGLPPLGGSKVTKKTTVKKVPNKPATVAKKTASSKKGKSWRPDQQNPKAKHVQAALSLKEGDSISMRVRAGRGTKVVTGTLKGYRYQGAQTMPPEDRYTGDRTQIVLNDSSGRGIAYPLKNVEEISTGTLGTEGTSPVREDWHTGVFGWWMGREGPFGRYARGDEGDLRDRLAKIRDSGKSEQEMVDAVRALKKLFPNQEKHLENLARKLQGKNRVPRKRSSGSTAADDIRRLLGL